MRNIPQPDTPRHRPFFRSLIEQNRRHRAGMQKKSAEHQREWNLQQMRQPAQAKSAMTEHRDLLPIRSNGFIQPTLALIAMPRQKLIRILLQSLKPLSKIGRRKTRQL